HDGARRALQGVEVIAGGLAVSTGKVIGNWRGHNDVMQTWSFRGSGEPAWVIASSNACERLGPDPRRALGPAAIRAASTGRTHDRTRPMLHRRKKALVNQAPSTHDPSGITAAGSLAFDPRRFDNRPPFLDLCLLKGSERLRRLLVPWGNIEALVRAARPHRRIGEGFNDGGVELGDDAV